jgi:hypothetical protein
MTNDSESFIKKNVAFICSVDGKQCSKFYSTIIAAL